MAYNQFKQTFWSKHIQHELEKKAILASFCNKEFQGEAKFGNQVKILGVGKPTIGSYTGASIGDPETIQDSSVMLTIDRAKFFNFMVDDVDKAQSVPGLMEALMEEATLAMALQIDSDIAKEAGTNGGLLTATTQVNSAATAKQEVDKAILWLRENDVQIDSEVVMEIPPFMYQLLKDKYIELDTNNSKELARGIVGYYDNVRVRVSNNLYNDGTDYHALFRTKKAVAYVNQIDKVEPFRPQGLFSDAIKGLNVYGIKVVRPKELYVARVHK